MKMLKLDQRYQQKEGFKLKVCVRFFFSVMTVFPAGGK